MSIEKTTEGQKPSGQGGMPPPSGLVLVDWQKHVAENKVKAINNNFFIVINLID